MTAPNFLHPGASLRPTLYGLRQMYPSLFHPNQDWFDGEAFMAVPLSEHAHTTLPSFIWNHSDYEPDAFEPMARTPGALPAAVELAALYVAHPFAPVWRRYLWTADTDHDGQRVYVGDNGKGLEIHRHLHLTEKWGVPCWD